MWSIKGCALWGFFKRSSRWPQEVRIRYPVLLALYHTASALPVPGYHFTQDPFPVSVPVPLPARKPPSPSQLLWGLLYWLLVDNPSLKSCLEPAVLPVSGALWLLVRVPSLPSCLGQPSAELVGEEVPVMLPHPLSCCVWNWRFTDSEVLSKCQGSQIIHWTQALAPTPPDSPLPKMLCFFP